MSSWKVIRIRNPEKYKPFAKEYGIMVESLPNTAIINFDSNVDYGIVSLKAIRYYRTQNLPPLGVQSISPYGGYFPTGLKIY